MSDDAESAGETVWYRADYRGFATGQDATPVPDPHDGGLYVYAVSDLQAARAYAAIREHQDHVKRSVYRVTVIGEPLCDPDYAVFPEFVRCVSGILEEVVEAHPTMSPDEATEYICQTYNPPGRVVVAPCTTATDTRRLPLQCRKPGLVRPSFAALENICRRKPSGTAQRSW
jgi:hypothetical protein